jgi:hypothetical protein
VHLIFFPPARFYVSDLSVVLLPSYFSGNSLCHLSLGKKPWSIITVGVLGKKRWHHMFVFQDREHLPFVYLWQLAGWLAILIRNGYFSSPRRSMLQALNRLRIGLPITAKIIAQVQV